MPVDALSKLTQVPTSGARSTGRSACGLSRRSRVREIWSDGTAAPSAMEELAGEVVGAAAAVLEGVEGVEDEYAALGVGAEDRLDEAEVVDRAEGHALVRVDVCRMRRGRGFAPIVEVGRSRCPGMHEEDAVPFGEHHAHDAPGLLVGVVPGAEHRRGIHLAAARSLPREPVFQAYAAHVHTALLEKAIDCHERS